MVHDKPRRWAFYHWSLLIHPLVPLIFKGVDNVCNPTLHIVIPCVGCLMICYRPGPLRTKPCAECKRLIHWIDQGARVKRRIKNTRQLSRRLAWWNNLVAVEMADAYTKIVRRPDGKSGHSYRRPGSQNGRK